MHTIPLLVLSLAPLNELQDAGSPSSGLGISARPQLALIHTAQGPVPTVRRLGPGLLVPSSGTGCGIANGEFEDGLADWITSIDPPGSTGAGLSLVPGVFSQRVQFEEGGAFRVTLEQTFCIPFDIDVVSFCVEPAFDLTTSFIPDAFEATLLDENGLPAVEPWDLFATSCFNLQEDGTVNSGSNTTMSGEFVSIDVSAIPDGTSVTIYFDLIGGDGDTGSSVELSKVLTTAGVSTTYGCGFNPTGSLVLTSPAPTLGTTLQLELDNPLGTQNPGSLSAFGLAISPAPGFPCGIPIPGFGMGGPGAIGELLIPTDLASGLINIEIGSPWLGTGSPVSYSLEVPVLCALANERIFLQGVLLDLTPGATVPIALSEALEILVGP